MMKWRGCWRDILMWWQCEGLPRQAGAPKAGMTRLTNKLKHVVVEQFQSGVSTELLAERLRVGIWQIEAVLRATLKR